MLMRSKGGDSNRHFQSTFFKPQVKRDEDKKKVQNAEKNRSDFWASKTKEPSPAVDVSIDIFALGARILGSICSRR